MANVLKGKQVVAAMKEKLIAEVEALGAKGVTPTLGIIRIGERPDDISYEKGATKRCAEVGVAFKQYLLPENATQDELLKVIDEVNNDKNVHGVLLFRPLPKGMDDATVRRIRKALLIFNGAFQQICEIGVGLHTLKQVGEGGLRVFAMGVPV